MRSSASILRALEGTFRRVVAVTCLAVAFGAASHAAEPGSIGGNVTIGASNLPLEGAIVRLAELGRETSTANDGRFRFNGVPPGNYTLIVDYLGSAPQESVVSVGENQTVSTTIAFARASADDPTFESITVYGTIAGSLAARNKERAADTLKTVVGADAIGQFADQNVAESLQRLVGLSIQRDEGEGRFVSVRGLSPDFNNVTVNGVRVGAGGDGFDFSDLGGSRTVSLDVVPSDLLESIEVTKTRTADMDADIIGGSIELKSLSAFDRGGFSANFRVEGSHNDIADETSPKLSASVTQLFDVAGGSDNFGVALAANYFDRDVELTDIRSDNGLREVSDGTGGDILVPGELDPRYEVGNRERSGATLNLDFRPTDNSEYYLRTTYTRLRDDDIRIQQNWDLDDARGGEILSAGPGIEGVFEDVDIEKRVFFQDKDNEVTTLSLGGTNRVGLWTFDYSGTLSENRYRLPEGFRGQFRVRDTITTWTADDTGYTATSIQGEGNGDRDPALLESYQLDQLLVIGDRRDDKIGALKLDITRDMNFGDRPGMLKFGAQVSNREKRADRTRASESNSFDALGNVTLADIPVFSPTGRYDGFEFFPELDSARTLFRSLVPVAEGSGDPITTQANRTRRDFVVDENVVSAYLMGKVDVTDRLRLTAGLRAERTEWRGFGFEVERVNFDSDSTVNPINPGEPPDDFTLAPIPLSADTDYTDVLPSLHLRYEPSDSTVIRASVTQAIQRPAFNDNFPRRDILSGQDGEDGPFEREVDLGNPDLDPLEATMFDASIAWYPNEYSVLTAGVFYKDIDNFFIDARFEGDDVTLLGLPPANGNAGAAGGFDEATIVLNGESAEVYGIEFSYIQNFYALPAPWDGLFVEANATFADSDADFGALIEQARDLPGEDLPLPDQADVVGNLSFGWENANLTARTSWTYRDELLREIATSREEDIIRKRHLTWDVGLSYRINDTYEVYFDAININEARDRDTLRGADLGRVFEQFEAYGRTFQFGVTGTY